MVIAYLWKEILVSCVVKYGFLFLFPTKLIFFAEVIQPAEVFTNLMYVPSSSWNDGLPGWFNLTCNQKKLSRDNFKFHQTTKSAPKQYPIENDVQIYFWISNTIVAKLQDALTTPSTLYSAWSILDAGLEEHSFALSW